MADPLDPFGLGKRDDDRDPRTGPSVPNMGGIPQQPMSPTANLSPFAVPPVAGDQGGRPPEPAPPTAPTSTTAAPTEPQQETTTPTSGVTINVGGSGQQGQAAAPTGAMTGAPTAPPTNPAAPGLPAPVKLDRLPTVPELQFAPPGSTFETPLGTMSSKPDGTGYDFQPNEAGVLKYKELKTREITNFGAYPYAGKAGAPLPPVEPGQPWYNPISGTWGGIE